MNVRRFWLAVSGIALLCCAAMLLFDWQRIVDMNFRDTDDALRYVEVHAFLNGQNWLDVSQHRVNTPIGGPMHWSRLVDLPIAGLMALFQPLVGTALSDRIAMTLVPLGLTAALFGMFALATRRIAGDRIALTATALLAISLSILIQFHPLRIDHHEWQILMGAVTLWAAFDGNPRRGGVIAGVAVAFWLHVSAEAMPYAALFGGLFGLHVISRAAEWPRLLAYMGSLACGSAALLLLVRGWPAAGVYWCDAMSPTYLLPMIAVALALPLASHLIGEHSVLRRTLVIALSALAGGAVFLFTGRQCLGGPFEALDPVVYTMWYVHVAEGRPIWDQTGVIAAVVAAPAFLGLVGYILAIRRAQDPARRQAWLAMALLALGATAVAMMVMRAMSIAHLYLLPGNAYLLLMLAARAQALTRAPARIIATVMLVLVTPLGIEAAVLPVVSLGEKTGTAPTHDTDQCVLPGELRGLAALPEGKIFAPLDISAFLLAFTPHTVVATNHHRNNLAMKDVILGFTQDQAQARGIVMRNNADYVAYCPDWSEVERYALQRPDALIGDLHRNRPPGWLIPVPMRTGESIRVYRVRYAPGTKRIATPFMQ